MYDNNICFSFELFPKDGLQNGRLRIGAFREFPEATKRSPFRQNWLHFDENIHLDFWVDLVKLTRSYCFQCPNIFVCITQTYLPIMETWNLESDVILKKMALSFWVKNHIVSGEVCYWWMIKVWSSFQIVSIWICRVIDETSYLYHVEVWSNGVVKRDGFVARLYKSRTHVAFKLICDVHEYVQSYSMIYEPVVGSRNVQFAQLSQISFSFPCVEFNNENDSIRLQIS